MSDIGVVILNYGDPADTLACLSSLERSHDLALDIAVVDNGPEGPSFDALRAAVGDRAVTLATGENLGYAGGNNIGIRHLMDRGADLLLVLNPDTLVEPDCIGQLRAHLEAVPDCGIVGPRMLLPGTPSRIWFDGGVVDRRTGATSHVHHGAAEARFAPVVGDVDYVTGACMLVRRSLIEDIGPLPEQYFLYHEETDWCLRAQAAGWRTMVEQRARITHLKRSSGRLPQPYYLYYMVRSRLLFAEQCLGLGADGALPALQEKFIEPWRVRVAEEAADWLADFDDLVRQALVDARAGVVGRNDAITDHPGPRMSRA
jgi:GT2 family glycosyltransferase